MKNVLKVFLLACLVTVQIEAQPVLQNLDEQEFVQLVKQLEQKGISEQEVVGHLNELMLAHSCPQKMRATFFGSGFVSMVCVLLAFWKGAEIFDTWKKDYLAKHVTGLSQDRQLKSDMKTLERVLCCVFALSSAFGLGITAECLSKLWDHYCCNEADDIPTVF
ncbi:hypothetical protein K2X40_03520 [Candidatus Babeliales bacterium]|nr:hypothetical protein [Candidatus Babeliales bacterium]